MARYYYDVQRATSTNGTTQTETIHAACKTAANKRQARITAISVIARGSTAGGGALRPKSNTGTVYSGGTAHTPGTRDATGPAAGLTWVDDATAITAGTTLIVRQAVGFAQTGGNNMWVATEPDAALCMEPNTVSPVDYEFSSIAIGTSIPIDVAFEFYE